MSATLKYFISYAHGDKAAANRLLKLLHVQLKIAADFNFQHWQDPMIVLGEAWRAQIKQAMQEADFGLLLISPNFLASDYIANIELPEFIGLTQQGELTLNKPIVPVSLKPVRFDGSVNLHGLEQAQIFTDQQGRSFSKTQGYISEAYADQLAAQIVHKFKAAKL